MPYFYLSSMRPLSSLYLLTFLYLYLISFSYSGMLCNCRNFSDNFCKSIFNIYLKLCHYISANADDGIMCNSENFV